jgi:hypothetical protein
MSVLIAASVAVSARPASAYNYGGCHWGLAPAAVTYEIAEGSDPAGEAKYHQWLDRAVANWNAHMNGQLKFSPYVDNSTMPADILVRIDRFGTSIPHAGEFRYSGCRTGSGYDRRWVPQTTVYVNRDYMEIEFSNVQGADVHVVGEVFLHELGHSVGLDHEALYTGQNPGDTRTPSACNIMYYSANPFYPDQECAGRGEILKPDDLEGAISFYPPPDPPDPSKPEIPKDYHDYFPDNMCIGGWFC